MIMITKKTSLLQKLKIALTIVTILLLVAILAFVVFYFWASPGTLPPDKRSEIITYSHTGVPPTTPETFTIMTYNIGYLSGMTNNLPMKPGKPLFEKNMGTFLQLIKEVQPDFIGFQEIDFHSRRSQHDTAGRIGRHRFTSAGCCPVKPYSAAGRSYRRSGSYCKNPKINHSITIPFTWIAWSRW